MTPLFIPIGSTSEAKMLVEQIWTANSGRNFNY